jgi:hypothetical protein
MFLPVRDEEGNLLCRANSETGEVEIERRIHGRKVLCVVNPKTLKVRPVAREARARAPARARTRDMRE